MKCVKCGHEEYTISNSTAASPHSISFNVTITTGGSNQMPTYQFHLNCECFKNNHKDTRAHVVG